MVLIPSPKLSNPSRQSLLLGTALASTLLLSSLATPAQAVVNDCADPGPDAVQISAAAPVICINTEVRNEAGVDYAISIDTTGVGSSIFINNSGMLTAVNPAGDAIGIRTETADADSAITILSSGDIGVQTAGNLAFTVGIYALTSDSGSAIAIENTGNVTVTSTGDQSDAFGVFTRVFTFVDGASTRIVNRDTIGVTTTGDDSDAYGISAAAIFGSNSSITVINRAAINATASGYSSGALGIYSYTYGANNSIAISNNSKVRATAASGNAFGMEAITRYTNSPITIMNTGDLNITGFAAYGINAATYGGNSDITIVEGAAITATGAVVAYGISAVTVGNNSNISIKNASHITATSGGLYAIGINAYTYGNNSGITINNIGDIKARTPALAYGIRSYAYGNNSPITIKNRGNITARSYLAAGIVAVGGSPVSITNSGDVTSKGTTAADGIGGRVYGSTLQIVNSGKVAVSAPVLARGIVAQTIFGASTIRNSGRVTTNATYSYGIYAFNGGPNAPLTIFNSGDVTAKGGGGAYGYAFGMFVGTYDPSSPILINNSGSVWGADAGLHIHAYNGARATVINTGSITAQSLLAIDAHGNGGIDIFNAGTITGFIRLDADDRFINQAGGVFEARRRSNFGDGNGAGDNDLFRNLNGGTVHTNGNTSFVNLERFENSGLISMVDGATGDAFTISNTPGGTDLNFVASGNSTLAVDAFLGGPGNSSADTFTVEGNVSGVTWVDVNNTNAGPGVFNPQGIPVIFVTGNTPNSGAFQLAEPIDTGFFDYDLFFTPTGSGFWELRSFPGAGAYLLPQLVTAAQDIWHQGSSTWFDRTADLRVLLNGGAPPTVYGGKSLGEPVSGNFTPAVWVRGAGAWLERDDSQNTTAYRRNYRFDLDRDLEVMDFQMGIDLGKRDLLSPGDILVFGMLGGFVQASLDYDSLVREFDFDGGQVGAYATYLRGGLFVDTLLNAHLTELDANGTLGFPSELDANTVGLRTDTGYRFGGFSGDPFWEPLATLEVLWADIDGFSLGGNTVSFNDDANVRGRLGVRAGTRMAAWDGTFMEPFVIGSVWGNFTDDNQATLVSSGRTFRFEDDLDDVWGEVSVGVNFFNLTATTSVFAKVDVTFADDVSGVGGKAGMRVSW